MTNLDNLSAFWGI